MASKVITRAEAVSMAVNLEIKGRQFYLRAAEKTENAFAKTVFQKLADEELTHLRAFLAMTQKADRATVQPLPETKITLPLFNEHSQTTGQRVSADELAALRLAMKQEKEAMEFFTQAAAAAADEASGNLFNHICRQESYHYDLLQAEYDFIVKTGFWFNVPEFRMDGKV